ALNRSLEARPLLRELLDTEDGVEARYWLAVGGRDRGDVDAALSTFQRVWIDAVRGPWGERAAEALEAMGHPVTDLTSADARAVISRRIDALESARQYGEALEWIERLRVAEGQTKPTLSYARSLFRGRKYAEAAAAWLQVLPEDHASPTGADI